MQCELKTISILGVSTERGAGRAGASLGPEALRANGISDVLSTLGFEVKDYGDISDSYKPEQCSRTSLYAAVKCYESVREAVFVMLQAGELPLVLGGDHALSIGSVAAVSRYCHCINKPLCILWIDAHTDFNTFESSPSGHLNGMPAAVITGKGHDELLAIGHQVPMIDAHNVYQLGVRSIDPAELDLVTGSGAQVFDMRLVDEYGMRAIMTHILTEVERKQAHLHVSFDIDSLDPLLAPGTGVKSPGGLNYREAQLCMEMIHDSGLMKSMDLVELNPTLDIADITCQLAIDIVESLFGKQILPASYRPVLEN